MISTQGLMRFSMKYRHEYKYLISSGQMEILKHRLDGLMQKDSHAGEKGMYNISSLYFDDYYNRCYFENINGTDPREKYRIRIYNHSLEHISLECKRKERGKTLKTVYPLTLEQYKKIVAGKVDEEMLKSSPVLAKLCIEMLNRNLQPKVIVDYDRAPYVYKAGNVRITLDTNLSSSYETDKFLEGGYGKRPVMPKGLHLLEVKWDEFLPDVIYRACQLDNLQQTAYSKYYLCRKYNPMVIKKGTRA